MRINSRYYLFTSGAVRERADRERADRGQEPIEERQQSLATLISTL